ncbi:hypothetical protein CGLO_02687 [Colletotrichum gloeosporioides Cg-14]|uniref:Uncharacterized protein n=1 Tax=Colletotrichum gloeosporioides (strain Cg-14) TaxID=1237896 RepID=T0KXM6_COLGC|nr:hypothetical protein CGLO_02687 [Colletotrichum gloeosporioides Cg-14]
MSNNPLHLVDLSRNSCVDAEQEDDFVIFDRPDTAMDWDIVDAQSNDAEEICQDSGMDSNFGGNYSCGEVESEPQIEKSNVFWTTCETCGVASWNNGVQCCNNEDGNWITEMETDLDDLSIHSGLWHATKCVNTPSPAPDPNHEYSELLGATEGVKSTGTGPSIPIFFLEECELDNAQPFYAGNDVTHTEQAATKDKSPSPSRIPRLIKTMNLSSNTDVSSKILGESKTCSYSYFAGHRALRRALPPPSGGRATYRRCEACF